MADDLAAVMPFWGKAQPVDVGPIVDASASTGKTASMRIYGPISSIGAPYAVSAEEFGAALGALSDVDTIELHIHSPGGSAFDGVAIKNQLQQHPATVNVVVDGLAASAASMIAMAGDTVSMAPSSQMMIHDASALVVGQPADLRTAAEALEKISDSYADAYAAKAGGTAADWRAAMQPETWYKADEAVKAGLADRVLPKAKKATEPTTLFDLTIFAHAGRDAAPEPPMPAACSCGPHGTQAVAGAQHRGECAHKTPAEPPEQHPTHEEAVTLTPDQIKALRERLGLSEDADVSAINAKLDELEDAATKPNPPAITDETIAAHFGVDAAKVKTAVAAAKEDKGDKVTLSQVAYEELKANSTLGVEARKQQLEEARDAAIKAAVDTGKISRDRVEAWTNAWDKDPEGVKADLESLEARFPVASATGYAGSDGSDGDATKAFATDDEADALAAMAGLPKGSIR